MAAEKDVRYDLLEFDELPDRPPAQSQLEQQLAKIEGDPKLHKKAICISQYAQPTAATAAANILRKRHGWPEVAGWTFATRKVRMPDTGEERTGCFVQYDPSKVVEGEAEKHRAEKNKREAAAKAKRDQAAREKAAAEAKDKAAATR